MSDEIPAPAAPAAGDPKPSFFERLGGVLMSPGETFESIVRRPDWVVPLLVILVVAVAGGILIAGHVDFSELGREAMEMNPRAAQMSSSQIDAGAHMTGMIMRISAYASPAISVVVLLIVAGVLLMTGRAFGGEGDFRQAFAVTVYAWMPRVIKGVVGTVVLMTRQSPSIIDLQNPVMSNLAFLFDPKSNPLGFALGMSVDLFAIWSVVLLVFGFAAVLRVSRGKAAGVVVGWWIVVNLFSLIGPAMQAIRR